MAEIGRPSQFKQKSRKGKKSWRKNIDLQDVDEHLETKAESEILLGTQTPLFSEDREGSEVTGLKPEKRLKTHEILNARSAVPPLVNHGRRPDKKKQKVDRHLQKVLERAGFTNKNKSEAVFEKDGNLKVGELTDLWGAPATGSSSAGTDKQLGNTGGSKSRFSKVPEAPEPGTPAVQLPEAGLSYNPKLEDWKRSIQHAYDGIIEEELKIQKMAEEQARIDAIIAETESTLAKTEAEDAIDGDLVDDLSDNDDIKSLKLSVNPPAANKRKTQTERNKQRRHKLWLAEHKKLKELKHQRAFLVKLRAESTDSHAQKPSSTNAGTNAGTDATTDAPTKKGKLIRAHSNHPMIEQPLTIKLSDELDDSLRTLKPEGNLLKERLRSLQARGFVEARVPLRKPKRKFKMVEKHNYKHD